MASTPASSNLERLQAAGLIRAELPEDHQAVVDGLTGDEVDILVSIKQRLDAADEAQGLPPPEPGELPPFTNFIIY
jgi:hypothetical protein